MHTNSKSLIVYFQRERVDTFDIPRCVVTDILSKTMVFINCQELVTFLTPLMIIIHNYARVSYTLIKSMKQNAQLMAGSQQE